MLLWLCLIHFDGRFNKFNCNNCWHLNWWTLDDESSYWGGSIQSRQRKGRIYCLWAIWTAVDINLTRNAGEARKSQNLGNLLALSTALSAALSTALSAVRPVALAALIVISSALGWGRMVKVAWAWRVVPASIRIAVGIPAGWKNVMQLWTKTLNSRTRCEHCMINWECLGAKIERLTFHLSAKCKSFLQSLCLVVCRTFLRCWMTAPSFLLPVF